ncbi:hypothetical protein GALMADRAFT_473457 [Galerina marginata CBS 339.88]|uniref:EthD domain-containing protein n=1 Tax=Galerina marginata (strain CBS 339.88) TaxID=685588 RepID=A0A067T1S7_GALM3|nr:hypothetical protein GALMADRAFT_473457 [Galerina marginata CBS 339.88]
MAPKQTSPALLVFTQHLNEPNPSFSARAREWSSVVLNKLDNGALGSHGVADRSASLYTSNEHRLLTYSLTENQELSLIEEKLKDIDFGKSTTWRLYEPLSAAIETPASKPGSIVVLNEMTPAPEFEDDFNAWYADEHIPLLSCVPGWIYSRRYRFVGRSRDAEHGSGAPPPQYLAIHVWDNDLVFNTPPYKFAVSTPWRMRVVGNVVARERLVIEFVEDVLDEVAKNQPNRFQENERHNSLDFS